jgi:hypothetical protein
MRINPKIYNSITTTPFDVQELENGAKIELHSLNQNEALFNEYAPKAKFAIWSSIDGSEYKLLLEDSYYARLRELYGKRVNQCMVTFWSKVEKDRSRLMKIFFIPVSIILAAIFIILLAFPKLLNETSQLVVMGGALIGFIIVNVVINKKIDSIVNKHNSEAVEKIKNIVGHKHFDELMDETRAHYDDFFGIVEEEATEENVAAVEEKTEE